MIVPSSDPTEAMDLVVATPVFLDLTFVGLDGLPVLGEELFAADLMQTPGGGAITAIAAARLGLSTAIAAPLGRDEAGDVVRAALAAEGVELVERSAARTPTTVVFPLSGDRAMVTVDPGVRASAADVAATAAARRRAQPRPAVRRAGGRQRLRHGRRRRRPRLRGPPAGAARPRPRAVRQPARGTRPHRTS